VYISLTQHTRHTPNLKTRADAHEARDFLKISEPANIDAARPCELCAFPKESYAGALAHYVGDLAQFCHVMGTRGFDARLR
jgi:hypothetical protein